VIAVACGDLQKAHFDMESASAPKQNRGASRRESRCELWDRLERAPRATGSPKAVNASEEFLGQRRFVEPSDEIDGRYPCYDYGRDLPHFS